MGTEANFNDVLGMRGFTLGDSDKEYWVRANLMGGYELWADRAAPVVVGRVARMLYSFRISARVHGIWLTREVAYSEVKRYPAAHQEGIMDRSRGKRPR